MTIAQKTSERQTISLPPSADREPVQPAKGLLSLGQPKTPRQATCRPSALPPDSLVVVQPDHLAAPRRHERALIGDVNCPVTSNGYPGREG